MPCSPLLMPPSPVAILGFSSAVPGAGSWAERTGDLAYTLWEYIPAGVTRQGKWNCENGNLIALDPPSGASANVGTENGVAVDFETTNLSGVTLPATINPGDTWSQSLTLEVTQTLNGNTYPASNQLTSDCKAVGMESVTVEAGTFDAMRVECQTTMKLSLQMGDTPMENTLNLTGTNWYVQGVGPVKTVTGGLGFDSTVELISYNIP